DPGGDLNFNSFPQLKKWCEARGVKAKSFDEKHVEQMLVQVRKRMQGMKPTDHKYIDYLQVEELLRIKQVLGGSSLKKLQTIIDQTGHDGRLRNQYVHAGAGQTLRTSGKGVQM